MGDITLEKLEVAIDKQQGQINGFETRLDNLTRECHNVDKSIKSTVTRLSNQIKKLQQQQQNLVITHTGLVSNINDFKVELLLHVNEQHIAVLGKISKSKSWTISTILISLALMLTILLFTLSKVINSSG